jgi:putative transcriptional regulator
MHYIHPMIDNKLKIARVTNGNLTQAEVAQKAGCSRQTINSIENNKFIPSVELALRIAQLLHVRVEDIFFLSERQGML